MKNSNLIHWGLALIEAEKQGNEKLAKWLRARIKQLAK